MKKAFSHTLTMLIIIGLFTSCTNNVVNTVGITDSTSANKPGVVQSDWGELDGKKVNQ
jgi:hypothetical protein